MRIVRLHYTDGRFEDHEIADRWPNPHFFKHVLDETGNRVRTIIFQIGQRQDRDARIIHFVEVIKAAA